MKGFVRDYGKITGFAAAGAFLLSLVVGLVSGNLFAAALVRALLFALLFACLGAAARFVIMKYLPEVAGVRPASEAGASGTAVDITLPEENPVAAARASAYKRSQADAPADVEPVDSAPPAVEQTGENDVLDLEAPPSGPAAAVERDLADLLPPLPETGAPAAGEGQEADEDSVEEAESVDTPGQETVDMENGPGDLGALPDISALGAASHETGGRRAKSLRGAGPSLRSPGRAEQASTPGDAMKGALGSQDPSTLARAIRTVLKRDEKG